MKSEKVWCVRFAAGFRPRVGSDQRLLCKSARVHHGFSREDVEDEVRRMAEQAGLSRYLVLFSTEEFKRVPNIRIKENGGGI